MEKILVSACLAGFKVRYNGSDVPVENQIWTQWQREGRLIPLCPELSAGLPVPRLAAEISGDGGHAVIRGDAQVLEKEGRDVTKHFIDGANAALAMAKEHNIRIAILTDGSPSCGSTFIYDGSFLGNKKESNGVVTALLEDNGIKVFADSQIESAELYLKELERAV